MKRFKSLLILAVFIFLYCINAKAQTGIFIKMIEFKLDQISDIDYENEYFMTIKFNKGSTYEFKITNHLDANEKREPRVPTETNLMGEKYYELFSFACNKTGFYDILIRFKDNKTGNTAVVIKLVK